MEFRTTTVGPLKIYKSGFDRSCIGLVAPARGVAGRPYQISGTRWIAFGEVAEGYFHELIARNSWAKLDEMLYQIGGFSSYTWSRIVHHWYLGEGDSNTVDGCQFINFGRYNGRVLLIGPMLEQKIVPDRIGDSSIIALSPPARHCFAAYLAALPRAAAVAAAAAAITVPGGLGRGTIVRARLVTGAA